MPNGCHTKLTSNGRASKPAAAQFTPLVMLAIKRTKYIAKLAFRRGIVGGRCLPLAMACSAMAAAKCKPPKAESTCIDWAVLMRNQTIACILPIRVGPLVNTSLTRFYTRAPSLA